MRVVSFIITGIGKIIVMMFVGAIACPVLLFFGIPMFGLLVWFFGGVVFADKHLFVQGLDIAFNIVRFDDPTNRTDYVMHIATIGGVIFGFLLGLLWAFRDVSK